MFLIFRIGFDVKTEVNEDENIMAAKKQQTKNEIILLQWSHARARAKRTFVEGVCNAESTCMYCV